jgi:UDP-N-acetylglucosamine--N-acetylmuramyl-(pentapeptide) pyrophosphoryl-undecaprenol N-acetylglucosamine transferase
LQKDVTYRVVISGGGTGGHIFPAVAIANEFKSRYPNAEILFVGARGKMEMTRVPEAGYPILGLWISGLQRKLTVDNLLFPVKVVVSFFKAKKILKTYRPDVVVGTGGYASGPIMMAATRMKIPTVIQEQNSFAGLTNKKVANKASTICVAYQGMEKYFPKEKIVLTGNPVRKDMLTIAEKRTEALKHFGLQEDRKVVLVIGGSLGARTINESVLAGLPSFIAAGVQVIWQTGKGYFATYQEKLVTTDLTSIRVYDFVKEMDLAYAAADVVISRSGALAVSELCVAKKACILVPSPVVAEDHQTKNAQALVSKDAAVLVTDREARDVLVKKVLHLLEDEKQLQHLREKIGLLAKPNATVEIVNEIEKLIK